jgi:hypothetical protein
MFRVQGSEVQGFERDGLSVSCQIRTIYYLDSQVKQEGINI